MIREGSASLVPVDSVGGYMPRLSRQFSFSSLRVFSIQYRCRPFVRDDAGDAFFLKTSTADERLVVGWSTSSRLSWF